MRTAFLIKELSLSNNNRCLHGEAFLCRAICFSKTARQRTLARDIGSCYSGWGFGPVWGNWPSRRLDISNTHLELKRKFLNIYMDYFRSHVCLLRQIASYNTSCTARYIPNVSIFALQRQLRTLWRTKPESEISWYGWIFFWIFTNINPSLWYICINITCT